MVEFVCKAFKRHVYFVIIFYKVIFENQQKQSIKNRCFSKSGEECPMSAGFTKAMLCKQKGQITATRRNLTLEPKAKLQFVERNYFRE